MFNLVVHLVTGAGTIDQVRLDVLHVEERMEQRVDELGRHLHESRQLVLHGSVDVLVFVRGNLEILLELRALGVRQPSCWRASRQDHNAP